MTATPLPRSRYATRMTANLIRLSMISLLALGVSATTACKKPKQEYDGIKGFRVGRTTLKKATNMASACFPVEKGAKRCLARARELAGQKALVNLYFPEDDPKSKLEEIWVTVQRCKVEPTMAWMKKTFGKPTSENKQALQWKGKYAFIAAQVPDPDGDCQLHFVDPSSTNRIAKLSEKLAKQAK